VNSPSSAPLSLHAPPPGSHTTHAHTTHTQHTLPPLRPLPPDITHPPPFQPGTPNQRLAAWSALTRDRQLLEWLRHGYRAGTLANPPHKQPPHHPPYNVTDKHIQEQISLHIVEPVPTHQLHDHSFSPVLGIQQTDKTRFCINLRPTLNTRTSPPHFKLEGLHTLRHLLPQNAWMVKIDIEKAFWSFLLHPDTRKLIAFRWRGRHYRYRVLPFGFNYSPWLFNRFMGPIKRHLRRLGLQFTIYVDDILLYHTNPHTLRDHTITLIRTLQALGLTVQPHKCILTPTQRLTFLGVIVDSRDLTFALPAHKHTQIQQLASHLLHATRPTPRQLQSLIGQLEFARHTYPLTFQHTRHIRRAARFHQDWDKPIQLAQHVRRQLQFWTTAPLHLFRTHMRARHTVHAESDASETGSGGRTLNDQPPQIIYMIHPQSHIHSNIRELTAIERMVLHITTRHSHKIHKHNLPTCIHIITDNTTAQAYINKPWLDNSDPLSKITQRIHTHLHRKNMTIKASYCPGELIPETDALSRRTLDPHDWQLHPRLFQRLHARHNLSWDIFASMNTRQLPQYITRHPRRINRHFNALTTDWTRLNGNLYAFPPPILLPRTLQLIAQHQRPTLLIFPYWPSAPWFPLLLSLRPQIQFLPRPQHCLRLPFIHHKHLAYLPHHNRPWHMASAWISEFS